ncbi:RNA polymerase sigma factor [Fodinibius halophilus]|uniref:Sigma-70 family RNA polymerase sigma factor n=1 Tax=Fodinibius halophilus TaxID=1736908 RepID=A0A6M1T2W2_9BACT|nr:sigma-70 family RNA polymerase sigma factor [Fodinibius halophilus]NGP88379.1 sigma-70 family RNA polymerase sigma factor [Fodinibius halophilus]
MSKSRVDYSELVHALRENKQGKANELLEELLYRLKDYLKVVLNATEREAEECTQQAFLDVFEQIKKDNIREEKYIFSYMIRSCRHEFFRHAKEQHRFNNAMEDHQEHLVDPAEQFTNLMDEDRQRILEACLEELRESSRKFIEYFFEQPDTTTKEASAHFDISGANVRTKKSRILNRLHHCFKRKWRQ